jgi:hypothetical protein
MTKRKPPEQHKKPGPKPGFKCARAATPDAHKTSAQPKATPVMTFEPGRPPKSVDIDALNEPSLRNYAAAIGVSKRDVEGLTVDRLRQNCKAHLQHHFDLITEG